MRIKYISIIIFLFTLYFNSFSQSIDSKSLIVNSLTNKPEKIDIELDDVNNRIIIKSSSKDTIYLNGYTDLVSTIKVLNKKFIFIQYKIRGGSGVKMEMTTLICVNKGQLYKSLYIISMEKYELKDTHDKSTDSLKLYDENGLYSLEISNLKEEKEDFQLSLIQDQKISSKHYKKDDYEKLDTIKLNFDKKNKVFYTKYVTLKGGYKIKDSKMQQKVFKGKSYPSIDLRDNKCIIIDNVWYDILRGNYLIER